jgi:hypothetical protein
MRVAILAVLVACSSKHDDRPARPAPASPAAAPAAPASPALASDAAAAAVGPASALDCETLLSQSLRERYFAGAAVTTRAHSADHVECALAVPGSRALIGATCNATISSPEAIAVTTRQLKSHRRTKDLAIGKSGIEVEGGIAGDEATIWDDATPCQIRLALPSSTDIAAVARDVLAHLPR